MSALEKAALDILNVFLVDDGPRVRVAAWLPTGTLELVELGIVDSDRVRALADAGRAALADGREGESE